MIYCPEMQYQFFSTISGMIETEEFHNYPIRLPHAQYLSTEYYSTRTVLKSIVLHYTTHTDEEVLY
jgi:hypothetical protein